MCEAVEKFGDIAGKNVVFYVAKGATSKAVGQKRKNVERIIKKYSPKRVKVLEKNEILSYNIMIDIIE
jgi:transcription antitermination factor NusA-like protein